MAMVAQLEHLQQKGDLTGVDGDWEQSGQSPVVHPDYDFLTVNKYIIISVINYMDKENV